MRVGEVPCLHRQCTDSNSIWQYGGAVNLAVLSGPLLRRLRCLHRHPDLASAHGCPERVSHRRAGGLERLRVPRRVVDRRRRKLWPYPARLLRCGLRGRCLRTNVVLSYTAAVRPPCNRRLRLRDPTHDLGDFCYSYEVYKVLEPSLFKIYSDIDSPLSVMARIKVAVWSVTVYSSYGGLRSAY